VCSLEDNFVAGYSWRSVVHHIDLVVVVASRAPAVRDMGFSHCSYFDASLFYIKSKIEENIREFFIQWLPNYFITFDVIFTLCSIITFLK